MKKNGFISTTLIYTFFIMFLLLMVFLLNSYSSNRFLLEQFKYDIKNTFAEVSNGDIDLYIMVYDEATGDYELEKEIPKLGYYFEPSYSHCKNGSVMSYVNGNVSISTNRKDTCYAYFRESEEDIILKIYTQESADSEKVYVKKIPDFSYKLTSKSCTNGATLNFNNETRKFSITASSKTECEMVFTKTESDIKLNIFKENVYGNHEYNGIKYQEVDDVPGLNYSFSAYDCLNEDINTRITYDSVNAELYVESNGKNECNVYFNGGSSKVELIIMQETDAGVAGYTTGLKYTRTVSIPSTGYKYVGYLCDDKNATVTYSNGTFETSSNEQTVCRAYFNRYNGGVHINYYLQTSAGSYESVSSIPSLGYVYNKNKSSCVNNSTITVVNNVVVVDAIQDNEECNVYFDMTNTDIKVNVFVMDRETNKYVLSDVPKAGYEFYNAGCTNGATLEYINGILKVNTEQPTICDVYFN